MLLLTVDTQKVARTEIYKEFCPADVIQCVCNHTSSSTLFTP